MCKFPAPTKTDTRTPRPATRIAVVVHNEYVKNKEVTREC